MRELIRPGVFWVVRLGLFLSVVAWVVGQFTCRQLGLASPVGCGSIVVARRGLLFQGSAKSSPLRVDTLHLSQSRLDEWFDHEPVRWRRFGPSRTKAAWTVVEITFRHSKIIAIFALFYGVLKWVYRKRPEAQPCEA